MLCICFFNFNLNLIVSIAYNYPKGENILKIKKKTQFTKKFNKVVKQEDERDITARLNKKADHILDEYERQNQEIRERLKEKRS